MAKLKHLRVISGLIAEPGESGINWRFDMRWVVGREEAKWLIGSTTDRLGSVEMASWAILGRYKGIGGAGLDCR
jgi:hypothetical protein